MLKVADVVRDIVWSSEVAREALSRGILNLSAYADTIHETVEAAARKPVRRGTIVIALSRLSQSLRSQPPLEPDIFIDSLAVKSGLAELTYEKTRENREILRRLYRIEEFAQADFLAITHGLGELSIVVSESLKASVLELYAGRAPKLVLSGLAGLTVTFQEKYIDEPNVIFALIKPLALKRINIVEIVSTFSELTFILHEEDLELAFALMNRLVTRRRTTR